MREIFRHVKLVLGAILVILVEMESFSVAQAGV